MVLKNRRHRSRVMATATALVLGSLALAGCGAVVSTPGEISVVGAEVQYGDVLAQIGGPYVQVTSVMNNPNTDPHNFEASPRVAQTIASAKLIVQNGAGYDSFMNQLEAASANSSRVVLTVASLRHESTAANPHFWYSPSTMPMLAHLIADRLATIAPSHAAYFRARDTAFQTSWHSVTSALAAANRVVAHRAVATTEPVGDYLISAMGLNNLTPFRFQADVMNGIDPSPVDIVTQQNLLNRHLVGALCFNAQVSSPVTSALRALAVKDKVPLVAIYETMPAGQHVQGWMLEEINAIEAALTHGVSTMSFA
ncbi:MAG: zinc ABC transporter substrate-binding protein [Actinomycetota bacterium]|nr:zinc ABC transporter substrate-binding protein [Actinomycetota bacterium]